MDTDAASPTAAAMFDAHLIDVVGPVDEIWSLRSPQEMFNSATLPTRGDDPIWAEPLAAQRRNSNGERRNDHNTSTHIVNACPTTMEAQPIICLSSEHWGGGDDDKGHHHYSTNISVATTMPFDALLTCGLSPPFSSSAAPPPPPPPHPSAAAAPAAVVFDSRGDSHHHHHHQQQHPTGVVPTASCLPFRTNAPHPSQQQSPPPTQQQPQMQPAGADGPVDRTHNHKYPSNCFSSNLFVTELPPWVGDADLKSMFAPYGAIESAKVMLNIHTGKSRGIAFVKYFQSDDAKRAIAALDGHSIGDHRIGVRIANPKAIYKPAAPTRKIFLRNIPSSVSFERLQRHLSLFGEVTEVKIRIDTAQMHSGGGKPPTTGYDEDDDGPHGGVLDPNPATGMGGEPPSCKRIVFASFTTVESAERAAEALHSTIPFDECGGVPILAKMAETASRRDERLTTRRGSKGEGGEGSDGGPPFSAPCQEPPPQCRSIGRAPSVTTMQPLVSPPGHLTNHQPQPPQQYHQALPQAQPSSFVHQPQLFPQFVHQPHHHAGGGPMLVPSTSTYVRSDYAVLHSTPPCTTPHYHSSYSQQQQWRFDSAPTFVGEHPPLIMFNNPAQPASQHQLHHQLSAPRLLTSSVVQTVPSPPPSAGYGHPTLHGGAATTAIRGGMVAPPQVFSGPPVDGRITAHPTSSYIIHHTSAPPQNPQTFVGSARGWHVVPPALPTTLPPPMMPFHQNNNSAPVFAVPAPWAHQAHHTTSLPIQQQHQQFYCPSNTQSRNKSSATYY